MTSLTDPVAVIETRMVHDAHRRATTLLAEAARSPLIPADALRVLRDGVVATLRHHHECEDRDLWVLLTAADPSLLEPLALLSDEHDRLDAALDRLGADHSAAAAVAVRDLVHDHLAHEEPVLFPALRRHLTEGDWASFSERTVASTPPESAQLLMGLFHEVATDDEVDLILSRLPAEARARAPELRSGGEAWLAAVAEAER